MIRQIAAGLLAGAVAVAVLALTRPVAPPAATGDGPLYFDAASLEVLRPAAAPATAPTRTVIDRLDTRLDRFTYSEAPLRQVLDDFRRRAEVNIVVDWAGLDEAGIRQTTPVTLDLDDVPAGLALERALDHAWRNSRGGHRHDVGYEVEYGVVFVGLGLRAGVAQGHSPRTVMRVYDIRDLMMESAKFSDSFPRSLPAAMPPPRKAPDNSSALWRPDVDDPRPPATEMEAFSRLAEVIMSAIEPGSWEDRGGVDAHIRYWAGRAVVLQTPENQEMVESFFRDLRAELRAQRQGAANAK